MQARMELTAPLGARTAAGTGAADGGTIGSSGRRVDWIHWEGLARVEWTVSRASPLGEDANPLALKLATYSQSPVKGTAMGGLPCVPAARRSTP
jgi:hypothetical protein